MVLWKKESTSTDACYIDLLPSDEGSVGFMALKCMYGNVQKNDMVSLERRRKGNESFQAKNWTEAMKQYSDSIRFAVNGSENIGLGYANRSACFVHLKEYDKCIVDIELAKNAKYPQHLMYKLDKREEDCLNAMKESAEVDKKVITQLSFSPNRKFPGMADILEVRSNDKFGKHVVAKRDIEVGKIVLLEDGFVFAGNHDCELCCKTCAKQRVNFIPCPNCADVMFCSAKCMEANDLHKKTCDALYNRHYGSKLGVESILNAVSAFPNAESLMKFVECALATRDLDSPKCVSDSQLKYRLFLKLFATPQNKNAVSEQIFHVYKLLLDIPHIAQFFHSKQSKRFLMHLIWQHLSILITNGFGVPHTDTYFECMRMIGICTSLFNHSCVPNTLHLYHGNKMIAFIMRPVKKGEQLFVNYFEGVEQNQDRQKMLNFQCECSKCVPRWKQEDRNRIQSDELYSMLIRSYVSPEEFKNHEKRSLLKKVLQNWFAKFGRLPWSPEFKFMEDIYAKCCMEELANWDY